VNVTVNGEPQPVTEGTPMVSRELAEAMAQTRKVQDILAKVLGWFTPPRQGWSMYEASVTRSQLANAYRDGGIPMPNELRRFL
jgi:hypothetical protein